MNIILFGDSLFGRFNKNRIAQLERRIPSSMVHNMAAGGWNSEDGAKRVEYIAQLEPDICIMSFGANDVAPWKPQVTLARFIANISFMVRAFGRTKVIVLLCPPTSLQSLEQTKEFNDNLEIYNEAIRRICRERHAQYLDAGVLLKELDDYHEDDGIHLNERAYNLIITKVAELITGL